MSACCVSGCKNRHSSSNKIKFYRIPSGYRPFQANRRRLWLRAIQQVNGSTEELKGNARICSAHFISGEASMDHGSSDFVPSVFTCAKQSQSPKKKAKWFYGRRKRRRRTANAEDKEEKTNTPRIKSPVDLQSSVLMEETETPSSPSVPKEDETLTEESETETETKTINAKTTACQNMSSPSFKAQTDFPILSKRIPVVLLKPVFAPAGEYQCELCNQYFTNASQLLKHKQLHEEERSFICETCGKVFTSQADFTDHRCVPEPSFPCNMCDRSFTSSHYLKRHKLLHVKDGRKCQKCGVLFCRRHNHVLFTPQAESEQDSYLNESQHLDNDLTPETSLLKNPELNQTADIDDNAQSTMTATPLLTTTAQTLPPNPGPLPKIHVVRILPKIPVPVLKKPSSVPRLPPPGPRFSSQCRGQLPQHPELPPSLRIFSPQYLTSALLEVQRDYEYILSKERDVKKNKDIVKEEKCELPLVPPVKQGVEPTRKERTAYDLEIVL